MSSLWFIVPAHGRAQLTQICLRQLRRTCTALLRASIEATAIVIADDENLVTARDLGFGTIRRDNQSTSRKFNDGIQAALDPAHNQRPADYIVTMGSDDWVDHRLFLDLPDPDTIVGFPHASFVREDGRELRTLNVRSPGGVGVRIYPRQLMQPLGYRPADEDRRSGCDTSILRNVRAASPRAIVEHRHLHDYQIVDWKTEGEQLWPFELLRRHPLKGEPENPWFVLTGVYPMEALEEMADHYAHSARTLVLA